MFSVIVLLFILFFQILVCDLTNFLLFLLLLKIFIPLCDLTHFLLFLLLLKISIPLCDLTHFLLFLLLLKILIALCTEMVWCFTIVGSSTPFIESAQSVFRHTEAERIKPRIDLGFCYSHIIHCKFVRNELKIFTARVRSTREGNIYTWKCLSVHFGGGGVPLGLGLKAMCKSNWNHYETLGKSNISQNSMGLRTI